MIKVISSLTKRETEIVRLIAKGFKNCEIAKQLCISHKTNILKKLKLKSTNDMYSFIFRNSALIRVV